MAPEAVIDMTGERVLLPGGHPIEPGDAVVVATSGTTGAPKGVVLTHAAVAASAVATSARLEVTADDHWLACLPVAHVGGLAVVTRALLTGTPLTAIDRFEPDLVHGATEAGATLVSLVPTALARIDPNRFRIIVIGGSRPPTVTPPNVVATYGLTESGSGVVYEGRPLDGVDVRLSSSGEVQLRGPMLLRAYRDGTDPKDPHGWLATGDIGSWDADGRLHISGRAGDLIITGGENVWPDPVERALAANGKVADVAIIGEPDTEWGEIVVAYVVPTDPARPPTLDELRATAKESLPAFAAPRRLVLVDDLPRTAIGKIRRDAV
jgi:o-succinylbenzoate---CoA ligase